MRSFRWKLPALPEESHSPVKGFEGLALLSLTMMLASGFIMLHFSNFARDFFWGLFLLLIMVINHYANRR